MTSATAEAGSRSLPARVGWALLLLPRNIGILLLVVYRAVVSPL